MTFLVRGNDAVTAKPQNETQNSIFLQIQMLFLSSYCREILVKKATTNWPLYHFVLPCVCKLLVIFYVFAPNEQKVFIVLKHDKERMMKFLLWPSPCLLCTKVEIAAFLSCFHYQGRRRGHYHECFGKGPFWSTHTHSVEFHVKIAHFTFLTEFSVMMSAPEASADFAIASDTAPMPPSGYPQAPRIPSNSPITWCSRTYPLPGVANQLKVIKLVIRNHKYLMNAMYLWRTSIPPCNIGTYWHFSSICLLAIID